MFSQNQSSAILAILITPFLMLGHANGFTELPALTLVTIKPAAAVASLAQQATELEAVTTTTTLASSNAPATITNDAGLKQQQQQQQLDETTTVTNVATMTFKQNDEVLFAPVVKSFDDAATRDELVMVEERNAATKSYFGHDKLPELTENVANNEGNAVKITQINYAKEQLTEPTKTQTTTTLTSKAVDSAGNVLETVRLDDVVASNQRMESKLLAAAKTNEANAHQSLNVKETSAEGAKPQEDAESATEVSQPTIFSSTTKTTKKTATTSPTRPHPDIHVERQLKNGLYRIKLAEIVTDEFNGATEEDAKLHATAMPTATKMPPESSSMPLLNGNKINIVDLYPMKIEDFNPIIRDSNAKLLRERTVFSKEDVEEQRQNQLPNEVEVDQDADIALANGGATSVSAPLRDVGVNNAAAAALPGKHTVNHLVEAIASSIANKLDAHSVGDGISDFTGKVLAEQDGVITEIEQKFQLSEFTATEAIPSRTANIAATTTAAEVKADISTSTTPKTLIKKRPTIYSVNHKTLASHDFIDRRVKKSFDFPMHRVASDAIAMPHVDFANTKFNTDPKGSVAKNGASMEGMDKTTVSVAHPEFSTTKFYNSKELYSQLLQQHKEKIRQQQLASLKPAHPIDVNQLLDSTSTSTSTMTASTATTASASTIPVTHTSAMATATANNATTMTSMQVAATDTQQPNVQPKKFQKELKRAKLLLKTLSMLATTTTTTTTTTSASSATSSTSTPQTTAPLSADVVAARVTDESATFVTTKKISAMTPSVSSPSAAFTKLPTSTTVTNNMLSAPASLTTISEEGSVKINPPSTSTTARVTVSERRTTNPTKSSLKPIARPRILSRLQEKINSLECEIQNMPLDSHLWRGNETHELMLPIVVPQNCKIGDDCLPMLISWEGEAEIQSGDILIVEINDALLMISDKNKTNSAHTMQVYQVTRSGHEHCDVTEGILLDITPLVVDGRKLVTLYDKDLTEGVNLLIVVSEHWGAQCIRLKVTTKTDNCGENADCSAKGICFSNPTMEEYECQCCSGFAGPHCEEIDACTPSPCTNNGICVDLSQGHEGNSYQCLCPYGYTGKNCQYEADPCNPAECMNGGSCVGNSTHFRCDCTPGFAGPLCQHSLNECESSPCMHGICVDQEDGFRCFCQPGFAGELCNFEYNECESNPCQNAGECIDHIGSYECRCTKGYTGSRCQIKVDLCANKPCPAAHRCIDHGNDFSCECPGGQNGPDCNQMTRTQCNVNPCTHGGTCWSSGDSFYCACRPGYTGTMCEDEFVVETVISSSEFMVDDTSTRNFNEKTFGSPVVLKSPIELHNAYFAAGVLAAAIFIVAIVVTICHCKVNQTYRKFSTRSTTFFPILGFGRRPKSQSKLNKHWLSGKGLGSGNPLRASATRGSNGHLPGANGNQYTTTGSTALQQQQQQQLGLAGQLHERPFQRHLAMNLENDMYYTVDYSETSQQSPLIQ